MEATVTNARIAVANFLIMLMFLDFARMLFRAAWAQHKRPNFDRQTNRFRWAMGACFLALGAFFAWIMAAWAGWVRYSAETQANWLTACATLAVLARWCWARRGDDAAVPLDGVEDGR